jgi:hypothetical protein
MNRWTRLAVVSGAGLALSLTASPALAAPPDDPGSNRAEVTKVNIDVNDTHSVLKTDGEDFVLNERQVTTNPFGGDGDVITDSKLHAGQNDHVTRSNQTYRVTEADGSRTTAHATTVTANGETRTSKTKVK